MNRSERIEHCTWNGHRGRNVEGCESCGDTDIQPPAKGVPVYPLLEKRYQSTQRRFYGNTYWKPTRHDPRDFRTGTADRGVRAHLLSGPPRPCYPPNVMNVGTCADTAAQETYGQSRTRRASPENLSDFEAHRLQLLHLRLKPVILVLTPDLVPITVLCLGRCGNNQALSEDVEQLKPRRDLDTTVTRGLAGAAFPILVLRCFG